MKSAYFILLAIVCTFGEGKLRTKLVDENFSEDLNNEIAQLSTKEKGKENMKVYKCGSTEILFNYGNETSSPYVLQGSRWRNNRLTYKLMNYPPYLKLTDVLGAIAKAFTLWSRASALSFKRTTGNANINIAFVNTQHGDGHNFDGPGGTLAHAFYPIYGGAIHFDNNERWTINNPYCRRCIDLFQVATHEIGHVLGLEHSPFMNAVMYASYTFKRGFRLHEDDLRGIQALYPRRYG